MENRSQNIGIERYASWIIAGLMLLSLVLSFAFFQKQSLRLDESQSLWQTSHSPQMILKIVAEDVHVPLYHFMLHIWQLVFGSDVSLARLLSLFFFLISIPLIYRLARLCYSSETALFATALFSISPFMNWYGNEIRMYSLFVFLALLSQYFFIKIYKEKTSAAWYGFTFTCLFGIFTHYFFFLILFTDAVFYFYNRKLFEAHALRKFFTACSFLFVCFLPWLLYVLYLGSVSNTAPLLTSPTTVNLFNTFSEFLFGFQSDHLNTILVSLWPLTILFAFLALRKNKKISSETIYFLIAFILPNAVAFIVSLTLRPIYLTRYLIFTMPSMYLVIAWLVGTYPKKLAAIVRGILILLMATTLVVEAVSASTPVKENYREATAYLESHATASDVIAVSAPFTIYPVLYYYRGAAQLTTLPVWDMLKNGPVPPYIDAEFPKDVEAVKADHQNLWLLQSYDQGYQDKMRIYLDTHLERIFSRQFSPGLTLYEYKLRYDR